MQISLGGRDKLLVLVTNPLLTGILIEILFGISCVRCQRGQLSVDLPLTHLTD